MNELCIQSIRNGDRLTELPRLTNVRLIFADPTYNTGVDHRKGKKADSLPDDYLNWCQKWINLCVNTLADDASSPFLATANDRRASGN